MKRSIASVRNDVSSVLEHVPIDFGGGCSVSKATVMSYLIKSENVKQSIDIGIYRGRSFLPQALIHSKYTHGMVIGVDPYTNEDAMEHDHKELAEEIADFAENTDFNEIYESVILNLEKLGISGGAKIIRKTSDDAVKELADANKKYGLIHIDGNHDTDAVMKDVKNYLPLVQESGFLILDDISWRSVRPAVDYVKDRLVLIYTRVDTQNDYAVFWNGNSSLKKSLLRHNVAIAGEN